MFCISTLMNFDFSIFSPLKTLSLSTSILGGFKGKTYFVDFRIRKRSDKGPLATFFFPKGKASKLTLFFFFFEKKKISYVFGSHMYIFTQKMHLFRTCVKTPYFTKNKTICDFFLMKTHLHIKSIFLNVYMSVIFDFILESRKKKKSFSEFMSDIENSHIFHMKKIFFLVEIIWKNLKYEFFQNKNRKSSSYVCLFIPEDAGSAPASPDIKRHT